MYEPQSRQQKNKEAKLHLVDLTCLWQLKRNGAVGNTFKGVNKKLMHEILFTNEKSNNNHITTSIFSALKLLYFP